MSAEQIAAGLSEATLNPYAAFERDVPAGLQEDAMIAMSEATSGYDNPNVHILERDQLNACNHRAHGIITIGGKEYTFHFESGDWNGSVLLAWEGDKPFERHVPTRWALQPRRDLIDRAIAGGKGPSLLFKWDSILKNRPNVAAIPGKYGYDCHFQPGGYVERYWRDKAAEHQFEIVTQETADETRTILKEPNQ